MANKLPIWTSTCAVNFEETVTDERTVTYGASHGIIGPLLFTLLINDLPTKVTDFKILLSADDMAVYFSAENVRFPLGDYLE